MKLVLRRVSISLAIFATYTSSSALSQNLPEKRRYEEGIVLDNNLLTMNKYFKSVDIKIGDGPFPQSISVERTYDSIREFGEFSDLGSFGPWSFNHDLINVCVNCYVLGTNYLGEHLQYFTTAKGSTSFNPLTGQNKFADGNVLATGPKMALLDPEGNRWEYGRYTWVLPENHEGVSYPKYHVSKFTAANGENLHYVYDTNSGEVSSLDYVVNSRGLGFKFIRSGRKVIRVDAIATNCVPDNSSCTYSTIATTSYSYGNFATNADSIASFTNAAGAVTSYNYPPGGGNISSVTYPGSGGPEYTYPTVSGRTVQMDASGVWTAISGQWTGNGYNLTISDAVSASKIETTIINISQESRVKAVEDALGNRTSYVHDQYGRIVETIFPDGSKEILQRDDRNNVTSTTRIPKPGSGDQTLVKTTSFPQCDSLNFRMCNKPQSVTDYRGFRTDYSWSDVHGGIISEVSGLSSSGVCTMPDGVCPRVDYGYGTFTGVAGETFYLVTSETKRIDATHSVTRNFAYDASNHFYMKEELTTSASGSLRTCFKYDVMGRLISRTDPKAGLLSC